MAERKLNINAPLLSVRRSSSPSLTEAKKKILEKRHTLQNPNYKSDSSSMDLVTEPVAVPFNWEHIPGRRKGNNNSGSERPKEASIIAPSPRLPPGKSTVSSKKPSEKESKISNNNRNRSSSKSNSFNVSIVVRLDSEKELRKDDEKRVSNMEVDADDVDDDDEVYSDALEALSFTESFSMNCSASGVSGLEFDSFDVKKSGTFSTDPQTRDFMMSRFLPAAKAMTLQAPQYASRKQSVVAVLEPQPREVKKLVREEKKPLLNNTNVYDIVPYVPYPDGQCPEEESEDEDDDYNNSTTDISAKGCGLIPRLRIGNSLGLLNALPGMKMKNQPPLLTSGEVSKPSKISQIRSFSPGPAVKKAWDAIYKSKSSSRAASPDKQEVRKKNTESNRFSYSGELVQPGRLSPFRRAAAAGISPCRSRPQSPFRGARLPGDSKEAENNKASKLKFQKKGHGSIQEVKSQEAKISPIVEKTLYIDTASTVKLPSGNLSSVDIKGRIDTMTEGLDRIRGKVNGSSVKSSHEIKQHEGLEGRDMLNSAAPAGSIDASTLSNILHKRSQEIKAETIRLYASSQLLQGTSGEDSNIRNREIVVAENVGNGGTDSNVSPLPPPLPKSPSESWLWRALPLVSIKNSFLHSNQGAQSHAKRQNSTNTASSNSKWETIVKTSNLHHDHVRYSQELTTHKSQHSKSEESSSDFGDQF